VELVFGKYIDIIHSYNLDLWLFSPVGCYLHTHTHTDK
jgi:hypothetical protein